MAVATKSTSKPARVKRIVLDSSWVIESMRAGTKRQLRIPVSFRKEETRLSNRHEFDHAKIVVDTREWDSKSTNFLRCPARDPMEPKNVIEAQVRCAIRVGDVIHGLEKFWITLEQSRQTGARLDLLESVRFREPGGRRPSSGVEGFDLLQLPPSRLPRRHVRAQARVTAVRVGRVQEITPEDVIAEGGVLDEEQNRWSVPTGLPRWSWKREADTHLRVMRALWDARGMRGHYRFHNNPWVWVIECEPLNTESESDPQGG